MVTALMNGTGSSAPVSAHISSGLIPASRSGSGGHLRRLAQQLLNKLKNGAVQLFRRIYGDAVLVIAFDMMMDSDGAKLNVAGLLDGSNHAEQMVLQITVTIHEQSGVIDGS